MDKPLVDILENGDVVVGAVFFGCLSFGLCYKMR